MPAIDRFEAHDAHGSSRGTERIFRLAYGDPVYVALAQESVPTRISSSTGWAASPWLDNPFGFERGPRVVGRSGHK